MVMDETQGQEGVQTSPADAGTSMTGLSEEQQKAIEQMVAKVRSDSLTEIGRVSVAAKEGIKKATEAVTTRYKELMAKQLAGFEETITDQPDALTTIRERHKALMAEEEKAQIKADLDAANARLAEADRKEKESSITGLIQTIASTLGVDSAILGRLAKRTDGSKEQIEDIAKDLPKLNPPRIPSSLDSNRTRGGTQSEQRIRENYRNNPNDPKARADYEEWRRAKGI